MMAGMANISSSLRFEVLLNGKRVAVTGIEEFGVLSAIVTWVRRDPASLTDKLRGQEHFDEAQFLREFCELELTGLDSVRRTHHHWLREALVPGSEVTVRVLPPGDFDAPEV